MLHLQLDLEREECPTEHIARGTSTQSIPAGIAVTNAGHMDTHTTTTNPGGIDATAATRWIGQKSQPGHGHGYGTLGLEIFSFKCTFLTLSPAPDI